jgi:PEP-CTERM motif
VFHLKHTARRTAFTVIAILGVAAAATATWNQYAPPSVCLYCATPEHYETAVTISPRTLATTGVETRRGSMETPRSTSKVLPDISSAPPSHDRDGAVQADAPRGWQPWDDTSTPHTVNLSGGGPLWLGLGELRGMMAVSHYAEPSGGIATARPPAAQEPRSTTDEPQEAERPAPQPSTQPAPSPSGSSTPNGPPPNRGPGVAPPPGPTSAPEPPGGPPPAAGPPAATPSNAPPTNPFVGHTTPPADPFVPPAPKGLLDPAGPGGGTGTGGSGPAATPEPASVLLIGTGLVALLTNLRRRRLI